MINAAQAVERTLSAVAGEKIWWVNHVNDRITQMATGGKGSVKVGISDCHSLVPMMALSLRHRGFDVFVEQEEISIRWDDS